jgi:hypothetical protein
MALRLAAARVPVDVAVEELRGMANGRGDLLAGPAGLIIDAAPGATGDSGVPGRGQIADRGQRRRGPARRLGPRSIGSAD